MTRTSAPAAGFAYVEVLVAVLLLALCVLPAANAVRNGLAAGDAVPAKAAELRCMRDMMETVLAEPYAKLLAAQNGRDATSYSKAAGDGCVERKVFIDVHAKNGIGDTANATALLRIDVVSSQTDYSFTTLVAP